MTGRLRVVCTATCVLTIAGCAQASASAVDILVSVRRGEITAPDSITAGWTRVRVEEHDGGHILVIFRLPTGADDENLRTFLAALDSAIATPPPATALGGPEIGSVGEVIVELAPGEFVLGCLRRGDGGKRHATEGEAKRLVVTEANGNRVRPSPVATQEVALADFAYVGADRWPSGAHVLRVANQGRQDHQLRLARLRNGSSLRDWQSADEPSDHVEDVAGVARLGPGSVAFLPVELSRGEYVLYCLVTDAQSGKQHVELGMFRAIQVE